MSKFDKQHEEQFQKQLEDSRKNLVLGAKVYRAGWGDIEEGEVTLVSKADLDSRGNITENPRGKYDYWGARFSSSPTHEGQTYETRWFFDRSRAVTRLVDDLRDRAAEHRRHALKWEALADKHWGERNK